MALIVVKWGKGSAVVKATKEKLPPRTDEEVAAILAVCRGCEFFVDSACQHIGCKLCPGKQRTGSGFKAKIASRRMSCPLRLW
jgi:hypothetical protein